MHTKNTRHLRQWMILPLFSLVSLSGCILVDDDNDDESGETGNPTTGTDTGNWDTQGSTDSGSGTDSQGTTNTGDATGTSDSGTTTGTDGDTSTDDNTADPELPCGPGGDIYEDNDDLDNPASLDEQSAAAGITAGVVAGDMDVFAVTPSLSNPSSVTVHYTVEDEAGADLKLRLFDNNGELVGEAVDPREGLEETMQIDWTPMSGGIYKAAVVSDVGVCTPYTLAFNAQQCTDDYEDNDSADQAKPVTLGRSLEPLATQLTIHPDDADYFTLSVPTKDPALVMATHAGKPEDVAMSIQITDMDGQDVGDYAVDSDDTMTHVLANWVPEEANAEYQVHVKSDSETLACTPYELALQRCTDAFEDNDTPATGKAIPMGTHEATISDLDKDYYVIDEPGKRGTCTVEYTADTGEDMSLFLFEDGNLKPISEHHEDKVGDTEIMEVSWGPSDTRPLTLWLNAADKRCTSYTIRCESEM